MILVGKKSNALMVQLCKDILIQKIETAGWTSISQDITFSNVATQHSSDVGMIFFSYELNN